MELPAVGIKVDIYWYKLGRPAFVFSFFSTIVVRLENSQWGSRFPIIMNGAYQGLVDYKDLKALRREIKQVEEEMTSMGCEKYVWDCEVPSKRPDPDYQAKAGMNLAECFMTKSGRTVFEIFHLAIENGIKSKANLEMDLL